MKWSTYSIHTVQDRTAKALNMNKCTVSCVAAKSIISPVLSHSENLDHSRLQILTPSNKMLYADYLFILQKKTITYCIKTACYFEEKCYLFMELYSCSVHSFFTTLHFWKSSITLAINMVPKKLIGESFF